MAITTNNTQNNVTVQNNVGLIPGTDEVCPDEKALRDKERIMAKQHQAAKYRSIGDTFKFMGALMLAAGMGIVGNALTGVTSFSAVLPAIAASPVGLGFLAVAAAATAVSIGTEYLGAKYGSNAAFDQSEINAQHNARYVRKELSGQKVTRLNPDAPDHAPVVIYEQNVPPASGKSWAQVARVDPASREIAQAQAQVRT